MAVSRTSRLRLFVRTVEFEPEKQVAPGLAVRVEVERGVDAAFESVMQDEIEAVQVPEHVALDLAADQMREGLLDALGSQRFLEQFKIGGVVGPDVDIRGIAFVAGARMGDVADDAVGVSARRVHVVKMSKVGLIRSRAIRTDFVITQGV